MSFKQRVVAVLRHIRPLYVGVSKLYHVLQPGFWPGNPGAPDALRRAFEVAKTTGRPGDYYEFGLYRGYTFWAAQKACRDLGLSDVRFYGFDSFQGLPAVEGIDKVNKEFYRGQFACPKEKVIQNLDEHGFDWSRAELIEGWYAETLTQDLRERHPFRRATVAFLDCDLYTSTRDVLQWLEPYLDDTYLLLDDWYTYDDPELGQQKAYGELLGANPTLEAEDLGRFQVNGNWFRIRRREG